MYPVLWETTYFSIHSYGFMISLAILVCTVLLYRRAPREGYDPEHILEIVVVLGLSGLIGSKLLYILLNWDFYAQDWSRVFSLQAGGLSFYGAIILGIAAAFIWSRWRKISFWGITDLVAPYLLLGYAFGRIGCFLNGCCYGRETDFSLGLPAAFVDNVDRHPVQLYASLGALALFFLIIYLRKYRYFDGFQLITVIMFYGFLRFGTEFFRESEPLWLNLSLAQVVSLTGALVLGILLLLLMAKYKPPYRREYNE